MVDAVVSDGVRLAVRERGDPASPTVVLVHGYPDTSRVWGPVADLLAADYHVVTYDVRGAGDSDRPRRTADYRLEQLARDLYAVIDAVSPDRAVHLVGHDWGSVQAWEAVTAHGAERRIASYTSLSGPSLDHVGHWIRAHTSRPRDLAALLGQAVKSWYIDLFHVPLVAPLAWRLGLAQAFGPGIERLEGLPHRDDYPASTLPRDGACGIRLYRANIVPVLRHPRERRTTVPVQVIVALQDRYLSPRLVDGLERWVDRLWVRRIHSGHWLPRKAPKVFADAVRDLVDHVEGGPEPARLRRWRVAPPANSDVGPLANHTVVVTGAGSGIGRETALAFAGRGADVVVADVDMPAAEATAAEVRRSGVGGFAYGIDVSDVDAMETFVKTVVTEHGVPDIVVNNAGIGIGGRFIDTPADDWQRIVEVNLLGVGHGCRLFGSAMAERREGGQIVNIASAAAYTPSRALGAYAATKAGVLMLSECLRAELADEGVGVTAICPGIVNTNITRTSTYVGVPEAEQARRRDQVSARYARRNYPPAKVAAAVVDAALSNRAVVPVTPEAVGARLLSRISPAAMRRLARIDAL